MDFKTFITYNLAPIAGVVFQMMILLIGKNFTKKERIVFFATVGLEIAELVCYNIEFALQSLDHYTVWRVVMSAAGYIIRPALIYPFVYLLREDTMLKGNKLAFLDLFPLVVVVLVQQLAFGTDWVFYFDAQNNWHGGSLNLNWVSPIVCYFYMIETIVFIILTKTYNRKISVSLVAVLLVYAATAIIFESEYDIHGLGITAAVFSIVFFMFSIQANHLNAAKDDLKILSETDSLSQLSNRYYGEKLIDEKLAKKEAGTFAIIDLDDFKHINDTYGHMAGDEAIAKFAKTLKGNLKEDDIVMRLGGDEFAVYSTHSQSKEDGEVAVKNLFAQVNSIRLDAAGDNFVIRASVGVAHYDGIAEATFDSLYHLADRKLYEAKGKNGNTICY